MESGALNRVRLRRPEGWEMRLSAYLRARRRAPFAWGENDCLLFCAGAVAAVTGCDFADGRRGYGEAEARAMLESENLVRRITAALGPPHRNALQARRGDVVAMDLAAGTTAGVVDDSGERVAAVTFDGLIRLPLATARLVWSY